MFVCVAVGCAMEALVQNRCARTTGSRRWRQRSSISERRKLTPVFARYEHETQYGVPKAAVALAAFRGKLRENAMLGVVGDKEELPVLELPGVVPACLFSGKSEL